MHDITRLAALADEIAGLVRQLNSKITDAAAVHGVIAMVGVTADAYFDDGVSFPVVVVALTEPSKT